MEQVRGKYGGRYAEGYKYCSNCRLWFRGVDRCPYCGRILRAAPRRSRLRQPREYVDPAKYGLLWRAIA